MRTKSILLLVSSFAVIATVTVMGAGSKIYTQRSHGFLDMNAYAQPAVIVINADYQQLLRAKAWEQYRIQVKACGTELVSDQDACLQQARRTRKQNSGTSRKMNANKPKLANAQIASVK